jgi:hypothetical protein
MATAKKIPSSDFAVHLELSSFEAKVIMALVGNVVGGGIIREATDRVYNALNKIEILDDIVILSKNEVIVVNSNYRQGGK